MTSVWMLKSPEIKIKSESQEVKHNRPLNSPIKVLVAFGGQYKIRKRTGVVHFKTRHSNEV